MSESQKSLRWTLNVSFDVLGQTQKLKEREREERQRKNRGGDPLHLEKTLTGSHPSVAKQLGAR